MCELGCSCSISDSRGVTLATSPVISHEGGRDRFVIMTKRTYPLSFVTQI